MASVKGIKLMKIKNLFKQLKNIRASFEYKLAEMKNHYPCKAIAQKTIKPGETSILYTILGKRHVHEVSIQTLMDDPNLINKFPPTQAVKFGAIALGDLLFNLPEEKREEKFNQIKNTMLAKEENRVL